MISAQHCKYASITAPVAVDGTMTTAFVDTAGYSYATVILHQGVCAADITTLTLGDCDTSGGSYDTFVTYGTTADIEGATTIKPQEDTEEGKMFVLQVDLRGRKRYLDLSVVNDGTDPGNVASAICILSRPEQKPVTVADHGDVGSTGVVRI